jgi:hypothetical protein
MIEDASNREIGNAESGTALVLLVYDLKPGSSDAPADATSKAIN